MQKEQSLQRANRAKEQGALASDILADTTKKYALFLDVDGTLLDIAATPDTVVVPEGLADLLGRLSEGLEGALAVITGRRLQIIDALLAPEKLVGAGVHGAELRTTPGGAITPVAAPIPQALLAEMTELVQGWPGVLLEFKGPGLAIHFRQAQALKADIEAALRSHLEPYANVLVILPGKKLFEVVPAGHSKGRVLSTLAELPSFRNRVPIVIGDDVGDEPAFAAAQQMGGYALKVAGEHFGRSNVDLDGPAGVLSWLEGLAKRLKV
ncbi:MAG: trehalose-phosphatase [Hyphomicrobium sp.]